ncbi:hypothetical protein RI129_004633 [Pyrocoelia pectoralis]|uniref:DH domain-containing protein n=1 Tax=Pyrocoelia pectoralis TaxID=417401 RepID=A0AAN7VLA9_9COLE
MSAISSAIRKRDYGNIRRNRESGEVKSLVLEYESVLSREKCDNIPHKVMGSDVSSEKSIAYNSNNNNNIVKRRINELNKRQIENNAAPNKKVINTYYNRSKSEDITKKREYTWPPIITTRPTTEESKSTNCMSGETPKQGNSITSNSVVPQSHDNSSLANSSYNNSINGNEDRIQIPAQPSRLSDEFVEIEKKLKEAHQTIIELNNNHNVPTYTSEILHVFGNGHSSKQVLSDLDGVENVDIFVSERNGTDLNKDFGEVSKEDLINTDFIEAYNHKGCELLITSVNAVKECSSSNEDVTGALINDLNFTDDEQSSVTRNGKPLKQRNSINNQTYFTAEELNALIPEEEDYIEELLSENGNSVLNTAGIKSETIYDSLHNPRIAKVTSIRRKDQFVQIPQRNEDQTHKADIVKPKIRYIMEEIVDTEKKYMNHLECILLDYLPYLRKKKVVQKCAKMSDIFISVKDIYKSTKKFYKALKHCTNHEEVGKIFIEFKPLFEMYPGYCRNKPLVDHYLHNDFKEIVMKREKELNDHLGLGSHLLTPIQRLGKYTLFLEQIEKELRRENRTCIYITFAIELVRTQMATGDLYIAVDSIRGCPINLLEQGTLLLKENFNVLKPKKYEAVLFLFEKILIFTTRDTKNWDLFTYRGNIMLDELGIATCDYEPLLFVLKRFSSKGYNEFTIEAKRDKEKKIWTDQIEKLLWNQLVECREKQRNIKHDVSNDEASNGVTFRTRNPKNNSNSLPGHGRPKSKFYLNEV